MRLSSAFRWGILGTGRINFRVLPAFREAGQQVAIVGSRDPHRARAAAFEVGAERGGSYTDVLAADDVDAIYISLPNSLHAEWIVRSATAGKHVLCEKPLATSVEDCERAASACRSSGVHLAEAVMYRHHPRWDAVWRILRSGEIGPLLMVRAEFGYPLDWKGDIRFAPELGGGAIQDVGADCVNAVRWFLGEPTRVTGIALDRRDSGVDTHSAALLEYQSGALGVISCSLDCPIGQTFELVGERGRIEVPQAFLPRGQTLVRVTTPSGERTEVVAPANQYVRQFESFERLVRYGEPNLTPGSEAMRTQAVVADWRRGIGAQARVADAESAAGRGSPAANQSGDPVVKLTV